MTVIINGKNRKELFVNKTYVVFFTSNVVFYLFVPMKFIYFVAWTLVFAVYV